MKIWRTKRNHVFAALFTFMVFSGCLLADSIADAMHGCTAEASQQSGSADDCALCLTCSHGGTLIAPETVASGLSPATESVMIAIPDEHAPDGPPTRIDHPPQLA